MNFTKCGGGRILSVLLPLAVADSASGQPSDAGIQEEVVVLGTRLEESIPLDLRQFGNRVEIITAEDLQLGGFNDLGQSLQMQVPNLYLAPKNGAFDYMSCSLQGSRCQDILWLIDGVRINNRLYNSTSPLDTVPAHMVERIEVLYGGQGIFYGTQSVAGVVNVITKSFAEDPEAAVSFSVDGNHGVHASIDYRTTMQDHQLVFYASSDDADGFQPFQDEDYEPSSTDRNRGYDVLTGGLKYRYAFTPDSELTFHYHRTDNEVDWAAPSNRALSFNARVEDLFTVKWDYAAGENIELFVKGYVHEWDSHWTRYDNELDENGYLTGNTITRSAGDYWGYDDYGLTAMTRIRTGGIFDYALGYEHQRFSGRDEVLLIADKTESVNAFFGQLRTNAGRMQRTRLALGLRHNRPSGEGNITVGNFSAQHVFSDALFIRGSAGTSFRLPDAWQLYGNDPCCTLGNPDLEGEKSRNVNVGLGGSAAVADNLTWEVIAFDRVVDGLIGSTNGVRINSDSAVDFDGWELNLTIAFTADWSASLNYVSTTALGQGTSNQVIDIPENMLKVRTRYRSTNAPYEFSVALLNVGSVYDSVSGGIGRIEHGGYTVADLSGAYYFDEARRHRLGVRLENAFDEEYATSLGRAFRDSDSSSYPYENLGTPRTLHVAFGYRF